ncbi:MAG: hypothetical protein ACOYMB_03795 [Patescibacteria group bacterium]
MVDHLLEKNEFDYLKIYSFKQWDLFLHPNQYPYIGRCYAWAKRDEAKSLMDMNRTEREELFEVIIPLWNKVIHSIFQHNLSNFAIFANSASHLHAHLIPRYNKPVIFKGIKFVDSNPCGNYSPYIKKEIPINTFEEVKSSIVELINKLK